MGASCNSVVILYLFQLTARCLPGLPGESVLPHVEEGAGTGAGRSPDSLREEGTSALISLTLRSASLGVVQVRSIVRLR